MNDDSDKGGIVVVLGLILVLLLLMGGAGAYFLVGRQRMVLEQAEDARMAEAQARMQEAKARAEAEVAVLSLTPSENEKTSVGEDDSIRAAVESILRAQEDAWNRGDLDAFMDHYWKSEALTFSSGGKTTRGWMETLNRYRERYPTPEKMGRVKFSGLEITPLGNSAALVLGQWNLERESEPLSGSFSLVVRKFGDSWLIVHDHTSRMTD
jgi:beta-aspartyl-peptidase (threonine type)